MPPRSCISILAVAALAACARSDAPDAAGDGAAPRATFGASTGDGPVNGAIALNVKGGPNAGTYEAKMTSGGCSHGLAGKDTWGNQYSLDTQDPKQFSSLQLVVPSTEAAKQGTEELLMSISFGPLFGAQEAKYEIDTRSEARKRRGSGRITIDDRGGSGTVRFTGRTDEGVELEGTIECHTLMRAG